MTLREILKFTPFGRIAVIPYRFFAVALPGTIKQFSTAVRWTLSSREVYNHTYHLTELNSRYLDCYVAVISGHDMPTVRKYSRELETDAQLRAALMDRTLKSRERYNCDAEPRYGRRIGWYAMVRATKPRVVVETGVDHGLGTAVIAAALKRNTEEGFPGLVYATDIVPSCGHLLVEPYKTYCRLLIGDSVASLKSFDQPVDIFLHDSDHRPEYEWAEFLAIERQLHPGSLVLSDNSQHTSKLLEFAQRIGKNFLFFHDDPKDHWWPGEGIGSAFVPGVETLFQAPNLSTWSAAQ